MHEYYCDNNAFYKRSDSIIFIRRFDSSGYINKRIELYFLKINLDHIVYPSTLHVSNADSSKFHLNIMLTDTNSYSLSADTIRFSITLNSFQNNILNGIFNGTMYNGFNLNDSIQISNGQFDVELSIQF